MQFPEIITITDYRQFQSGGNAPARDEDIESAINTTFIQLNGICNNQIYLRWNITIDSDPLFLNTTKKDLIRQAFLLQTKYNLDYDNDTSEGTVQNTWGSNNTSITRPKRDKITQDVLNLLANAGVYQQFATQMIRTPSNSTICSSRYYAPQDNYATQEWVEQGFIPKKASFEVTDTRLFTYDATGMFTTIPLAGLVDLSNYYTKGECDIKFATKEEIPSLDNYYNKTETDTLLGGKVDKLSGPKKVYVTDISGQQNYVSFGTAATNLSIAQRNETGALAVSTPTADSHATTKAYVDSSIQNMVARFLTRTNDGLPFETKAQLTSAISTGTFYYGGSAVTPAQNDYTVVLHDESKTDPETQEDPTTRYVYVGGQWSFQYVVNNSGLTASQFAAVNSGITSSKVSDYDTHIANTSNPHSVTKAQVGLGNVDNTSDLNKPISTATQTALDGKATVAYIKEITAHQTVNTYEVPTLTTTDVTDLYNSLVAGRVTLIDFNPSGLGINTNYMVDIAKSVTGVAISFRFDDTMLLTYTINGSSVVVTYKEIGGKPLYLHNIWIEGASGGQWCGFGFQVICERATNFSDKNDIFTELKKLNPSATTFKFPAVSNTFPSYAGGFDNYVVGTAVIVQAGGSFTFKYLSPTISGTTLTYTEQSVTPYQNLSGSTYSKIRIA